MPIQWIIITAVIVLVVILAAFCLVFVIKKKQATTKVNQPFMDALTLYLGGKNNILTVEVEQGRLKITVTDLDLVDLEKLKTLTDKGIFVTGNTIKALFKDDALLIKQALEKR